MRRTLLEALIVAIVGTMVGLAANALSPRGLKLSRNYFPVSRNTTTNTQAPIVQTRTNASSWGGTNSPTKVDPVIERLRAKGLEFVLTPEVANLFRDPGYQIGTFVFIDARDDAEYEAGHIPGAYQLYYYRPEKYLPVVLPLTQIAQKIVVYCNGGDCEDSEFTALLLRDAGVSADKLRVYIGGFGDWKTNNLPTEIGQRLSGNIVHAK